MYSDALAFEAVRVTMERHCCCFLFSRYGNGYLTRVYCWERRNSMGLEKTQFVDERGIVYEIMYLNCAWFENDLE